MKSENRQPEIIILGLGPGDPGYLTVRAVDVLSSIKEVYLRTEEHPTFAGLPDGLVVHSFDRIYEEEDDYQVVYQRIADKVISLAQSQPPHLEGRLLPAETLKPNGRSVSVSD